MVRDQADAASRPLRIHQERMALRKDSAKALPWERCDWLDGAVTDLLLVLLIVGFFGLAVLFVRLCVSIVGDDVALPVESEASTDDAVAAS